MERYNFSSFKRKIAEKKHGEKRPIHIQDVMEHGLHDIYIFRIVPQNQTKDLISPHTKHSLCEPATSKWTRGWWFKGYERERERDKS